MTDQPDRVRERCPTCGSSVRVVFGDEGTNHYEPFPAERLEPSERELHDVAKQMEALGRFNASQDSEEAQDMGEVLTIYAKRIFASLPPEQEGQDERVTD